MEKNEFMVDLKTLRETWTGRVGHSVRPDGKAASDVIKDCMAAGVLCLSAKTKVRLLPALNIPMDVLKEAIEILKQACAKEA